MQRGNSAPKKYTVVVALPDFVTNGQPEYYSSLQLAWSAEDALHWGKERACVAVNEQYGSSNWSAVDDYAPVVVIEGDARIVMQAPNC